MSKLLEIHQNVEKVQNEIQDRQALILEVNNKYFLSLLPSHINRLVTLVESDFLPLPMEERFPKTYHTNTTFGADTQDINSFSQPDLFTTITTQELFITYTITFFNINLHDLLALKTEIIVQAGPNGDGVGSENFRIEVDAYTQSDFGEFTVIDKINDTTYSLIHSLFIKQHESVNPLPPFYSKIAIKFHNPNLFI